MARNSLSTALAELYALLGTASAPNATLLTAGVVAVYDHEPKPGDGLANCFVTVTPIGGGMTPEYWVLMTRVYSTWVEGASGAMTRLLTAIDAVDGLMTDGFGPSEWQIEALNDIGAYVAQNRLMVPRNDF